jgi:hypothetical protein
LSKSLKHSGYLRGGFPLEVGRMWQIPVRRDCRELSVFANQHTIRIVNQFYEERDEAEHHAVHLKVDEARALGEILLAAADVLERERDGWQYNTNQSNPALRRRDGGTPQLD